MTDPAALPATFAPARTSRTPLLIGVVAVLLLVAGLLFYLFVVNTTEKKLIGTWKEKQATPAAPGIAVTPMQMTFNPDKTYQTSVAGMTGTWELQGKTIKLAPKNTVSMGMPPMNWEIESIDATELKVKLGERVTMEFTR